MADEVEQVFPYAVKTLDDGYKVVDYGLIPWIHTTHTLCKCHKPKI
jgi:hypothetical protein